MASFDDIAPLSAVPVVNLKDITLPNNGLLLALNKSCKKNFRKKKYCQEYYANLAQTDLSKHAFTQCPFGFSSFAFVVGHLKCALTAFIPYPRLGGEQERARAIHHPEVKIPQENILAIHNALIFTYFKLERLHIDTIKNESMALHEIRKLNRTVKQTAERLYRIHKTEGLLQIWKTSELMSKQFDVIEILANESLAQLAPNTITEIYKIFDKCIHIYQTPDQRIKFGCTSGYVPKAYVSDKTFPIIATVLIENALKYSPPGSGIGVTIEKDEDSCLIKVANLVVQGIKLDNTIFNRGVRGQSDSDGSGNGLYVAQLIAKQHNSLITLNLETDQFNQARYTFSFRLRTI